MANESVLPMSYENILHHLKSVSDELGNVGPQHSVILVGGSLLAINRLRDSTKDVDTLTQITDELREAIRKVAEKNELPNDWFNDYARPFAPETIELHRCTLIIEYPRLRLLGIPLEQLFIMKMNAGRERDVSDLVMLWPHVCFTTANEAVEQYWRGYPNAPADEFLVSWVEQIISMAKTK